VPSLLSRSLVLYLPRLMSVVLEVSQSGHEGVEATLDEWPAALDLPLAAHG
jgi:hypothetical protein